MVAKRKVDTRWLTSVAVMAAISYVLAEFPKIPMGFLPFGSFLKLEVSNVPALVAGFSLGPLAGVCIVVVKNLIGMFSSSTGFVGELADVIMSLSFILPATLLYGRMRTRKGALVGMLVGVVASVIVAVPTNYFILIPTFMPGLIKRGVELDMGTYLSLTIPVFNLIKNGAVCLITFLLYKPLTPILRGGFRKGK